MFPTNNNSKNADPFADFYKDLITINHQLNQLEETKAFFTPFQSNSWNFPLLVIARTIFHQPNLAEHHLDENLANANDNNFTPLQTSEGKYPNSGQSDLEAFIFSQPLRRNRSIEKKAKQPITEDNLLLTICRVDTSLKNARRIISTVNPFVLQMATTEISAVDSFAHNNSSNSRQNDEEIQFPLEPDEKTSTPDSPQINYDRYILAQAIFYQKDTNRLKSEIVELEINITSSNETLRSISQKYFKRQAMLKNLLLDGKPEMAKINTMKEIIDLYSTMEKIKRETNQNEEKKRTALTKLETMSPSFLSAVNSNITENESVRVAETLNQLSQTSNTLLEQLTSEEQTLATIRNNLVQRLNEHREKINKHKLPISPITVEHKEDDKKEEEENWKKLVANYSRTRLTGVDVFNQRIEKEDMGPSELSKILFPITKNHF